MHGNETPYSNWIKFCRVVGITDVIICANFGDDLLRCLGVAPGVKFAVPHRLSLSSLQQCHTTVRVCDLAPFCRHCHLFAKI